MEQGNANARKIMVWDEIHNILDIREDLDQGLRLMAEQSQV